MRKATRRFALWLADIEGGVCAAPEECVDSLRELPAVTVVLEHREHGVTPTTRSFETTLRQDVEWQFTGLQWPGDVRPGVLVTVTWQAARDEVIVRTTALEEPISVDGVNYFHEYDARVVTREFDAGASNRGRVLHAVRKQGRVFEDGSAVLEEAGLAVRCAFGRGARGAFLLKNAVDQLIREGYLTRVEGSLDSAGYPSYPAAEGQKPADMLFYAPLVDEVDDPSDPAAAEGHDHWVKPFVRKLPPGAQPSEKQVELHEQVADEPLAPGYTFVKKHRRT